MIKWAAKNIKTISTLVGVVFTIVTAITAYAKVSYKVDEAYEKTNRIHEIEISITELKTILENEIDNREKRDRETIDRLKRIESLFIRRDK